MPRVTIIGAGGYVGLAYAVTFAHVGHDVVGLEIDVTKVQRLRQGNPPIFEPGLEPLLREGLESGRLRFTTDYGDALSGAEFALICVGTPPGERGATDMTAIATAARAIAEHAQGHLIVVNKSTMPVGSVQFVAKILAEHARQGTTFSVVANPEFLREGSAIEDILHPDRIVIGTDDPVAAERVAALYAAMDAPVVVTDSRSAEMIKYASNAFLALKISFINEVALICERLGADVTVVARGMGLDQRIGPRFLGAGVGFGGSCFPKDVRALAAMAEDVGIEGQLLRSILATNGMMRELAVTKLEAHLGGVAGKTIAILGLAFKPETDDIREAPAIDIIKRLRAAGARIRATDPVAMPRAASILPDVTYVPDAYAAATGADAVVLLTEWDAYRALDLDRLANAMRGHLFFDGRNVIDPKACHAAGLRYVGIGRPEMTPPAEPKTGKPATKQTVLPPASFVS